MSGSDRVLRRFTRASGVRLAAAMALAYLFSSCGGQSPAAPDAAQIPAPAPGVPAPAAEEPIEPSSPELLEPVPPPLPIPPPPGSPVMVGAGDIALCGHEGPELTARLLDRIGGVVFTLGDHAYPASTTENLFNCYHPSWGRHRERTRPTVGNHDYYGAGGVPYFEYFGANAGPRGRGYYSFQVGDWLAIALDSLNESASQAAWLRATLAASTARCVIAYWHHPLVSSRTPDTRPEVRQFWRILSEHGADVVVAAHEHVYERFAPLDASGTIDPQRGMRQFIAGTGGAPLDSFGAIHPYSEVRLREHGVLKLTLGPLSYAWEFVSVSGGTDTGIGTCH